MNIQESGLFHDWNGLLTGDQVQCAVKKLKDAPFFADTKGEDPDMVIYDVYSRTDTGPGHLSWGLTVLHPVTINGECAMTRGHWHENTDCAEYYWCLQGTGLLLLKDEAGKEWAEQMHPGTVHKIDGKCAHRLVNTGEEDLKVAACWPADSGHDYARMEQHPFSERCYKTEGNVEWKAATTNTRP